MGEISRFLEAAIITAVFALGALFVNYSSADNCNQAVRAGIERGPSHIVAN